MDSQDFMVTEYDDVEEEVYRPIELPPLPKLLPRPTIESVRDVTASEHKSIYLRPRRHSQGWWCLGLILVYTAYLVTHAYGQRLDFERKLKSPGTFARYLRLHEMPGWKAHLHFVQKNVTSLVSKEWTSAHRATNACVSTCDLFLDQLDEVCALVDLQLYYQIASATINQRTFDTLMVKGSLLHVEGQMSNLQRNLSHCVYALQKMRVELDLSRKILQQERKAISGRHMFPGWLNSREEERASALATKDAECRVLTDAITSSHRLESRYDSMLPLIDRVQRRLQIWIESIRLVPEARARRIYADTSHWRDYFDRSLYRICDRQLAQVIASFSLEALSPERTRRVMDDGSSFRG